MSYDSINDETSFVPLANEDTNAKNEKHEVKPMFFSREKMKVGLNLIYAFICTCIILLQFIPSSCNTEIIQRWIPMFGIFSIFITVWISFSNIDEPTPRYYMIFSCLWASFTFIILNVIINIVNTEQLYQYQTKEIELFCAIQWQNAKMWSWILFTYELVRDVYLLIILNGVDQNIQVLQLEMYNLSFKDCELAAEEDNQWESEEENENEDEEEDTQSETDDEYYHSCMSSASIPSHLSMESKQIKQCIL